MSIEIREEEQGDVAAVRDIVERAFGQRQEADLVDTLRANGGSLLSLVALLEGRIAGHVLYTPASVAGRLDGAALGPVAVVPECQRRGIGSALIEAGNRAISDEGWPFIVVLGHPGYYPRFGFAPAGKQGIRCEWDVPEDVFLLLVLDEAQMRGVSGLARYRPEFSGLA